MNDEEYTGAPGQSMSEDHTNDGGQSSQESALAARLNQLQRTIQDMNARTEEQQRLAQVNQQIAGVDQRVHAAEAETDSAEQALATALEEGDPSAIAKAQRILSEKSAAAVSARQARDSFVANARQAERRDGGARTESTTLDTTNLETWKSQNAAWYGIDPDMTRISHEIDRSIRAAGTYTVGSKEYFDAITRSMRQRFPDRFRGAPSSVTPRSEGGSAAPSGSRRYTASVQKSMQAFGMTPEQWDAARAIAVGKGLLGATQERGAVRS